MPSAQPRRSLKPGRRPPPALAAAVGASVLTLLLYLLPWRWPAAGLLAWPLILISTLVHELGHGLSALLLGGRFVALEIWPDASGRAVYLADFGRLRHALVAAGGLLGPAAMAWALFGAGATPARAGRAWRVCTLILFAVLLIWVRNLFGGVFVGGLAVVTLLLARRASPRVQQTACVFLAVQLSLSVFARSDYLFMRTAVTGGGVGASDTQQIARALYLPYWFWGGLIALASLLLLWQGLRRFALALR